MKEIFESFKEEISTTKYSTLHKDCDNYNSYYYVKSSVPLNIFVNTHSYKSDKSPSPSSAKYWTAKNVEVVSEVKSHELFGSCLFFQHLKTQEMVLGKEAKISKASMKSRESLREKKYWSKVCKHNKFYPLLGQINISNRSFFLTENIPSVSLKTLISSRPLQECDASKICAQISLGVGYLHENGIIHRSLRPEIISIDWRGVVRIADLSSCESKGASTPVSDQLPFPYVPPEILLGENYDFACDWWNVGVIFYEMITGKVLFIDKSVDRVYKNISKDCFREALEDVIRMALQYDDNVSVNARLLLKALLEKDKNKRLKWSRDKKLSIVMEHPYFQDIDWQKLNASPRIGEIRMDLKCCQWTMDYIQILQLLGDDYGHTFGKCYAICHKKSNESAVLKIIWKSQMRQTSDGWRVVMNERLSWQKVTGHPYILPLHTFIETEATYGFIATLVDGCSLSVVNKSAPLLEEVVKLLGAQLALAVNFCHQKGIMIRNLSPDSVIIEKSGRVRLANFQFAKEAESSRSRVGSLDYMSPEMIVGAEYGKEADWFAFGVIIFEMIVGATPLAIFCRKKGLSRSRAFGTDVLLRAVESIPKLVNGNFSNSARLALKDLLAFNASERLGYRRDTLDALRSHQFFRTLKWKLLDNPNV